MKILDTWKKSPLRFHWLAFGVICLLCYAFFVHPDVIETANHSYLLLDSLFKGRFLDFYQYVMEHPYKDGLYYINNAHYNVVIYIIFGIAELPVYIFSSIFGTGINEPLLYYIGKLVSAGFFLGCIPLVRRIAAQLGFSAEDSRWSGLFFALLPPAFFSAMVMGQYDSLCLFFLLLGFLNWLRGKHLAFALWMGVGAACKFFPLLLVVPLLLLAEKRIWPIIKYGLLSLWLVVPTSLLFAGRTGDMGVFNDIMMGRLFAAKIPATSLPLFPVLYFILCFVAYLWTPKEENLHRTGLWLCLAAFGLLFIFVEWHPQWIILIAPFLVLTTFAEKQKLPWFLLDIVFSAGFFMWTAIAHATQLEANLLDFGLLGKATGLLTTGVQGGYNAISFYYSLLPIITAVPMVLFAGALVLHIVLKLPGKHGTPASRLAGGNTLLQTQKYALFGWLIFGAGMAVWLLPTLFTWCKALGIL